MKYPAPKNRRTFLGTAALATAGAALAPRTTWAAPGKPNSNFNGVNIGVISYSWRSMPCTAEDVVNYCVSGGISSIELMGDVAEAFAGIPPSPPKVGKKVSLTEQQKQAHQAAIDAQTAWRLNAPMKRYRELGRLFKQAGVSIHTVKFAPANWSDEEIEYAFTAAKAIGAKAITNEIGEDACRKLGKFAEKHDMYAVFHNHLQPGEPGFNFDKFLAYSPRNMLNFDIGHYWGATGKNPADEVKRLHDRIYSIHLKDKTGKNDNPANTNMAWGQGTTPLGEILNLIKDNKWPIYCDIELEYPVPDNSTAQQEVIKCVQHCRKLLV